MISFQDQLQHDSLSKNAEVNLAASLKVIMMKVSKLTALHLVLACGPILAQSAGVTDEVYLHCVAQNDPTSANDIHINKKSKTMTNDFGTAQKYVESSQFLIAEVFSDPDASGKRTLLSTTKINTFNLEVLRMNHPLATASVLKCEKVEKKI